MRKKQHGFTLIELLIGMGVTLMGMAGLIAMHGSMTSGNRDAYHIRESSTTVEDLVEQLRAIPGSKLMEIKNVKGDGLIDTVIGQSGMTYARYWTIERVPNTTLIKVKVEIGWNRSGEINTQNPEFDKLVFFEFLKDDYNGG